MRFTPARFMTLLIIILRFPLLLCCPLFSFFLGLLHLMESREESTEEEECTSREVRDFPANNKINYKQHGAGLQKSKEKKQRSHF